LLYLDDLSLLNNNRKNNRNQGSMKKFLATVRAPFFTGVIVPVILGTAIAWHAGYPVHWGYFFLTLIGIIAIHAGANTINDYFDHLSSNDEINEEYVRPFTGGSRMIQDQSITPKGMLRLSIAMYALGAVIGLYLAYSRGMPIFWIGLIGVAMGVLYVAPGVNLLSRGVGELAILIAFGVLCVQGSYYVQTQSLDLEPLLLSLPIGMLIMLVLWINEFPDFNADQAVGKNHWVVRLGKEKAAKYYFAFMAVTYAMIIILALLYNLWLLVALLMLPHAWKIGRNAVKNYADTKALIPSNAGTILAHLLTGILLTCGYIIDTIV